MSTPPTQDHREETDILKCYILVLKVDTLISEEREEKQVISYTEILWEKEPGSETGRGTFTFYFTSYKIFLNFLLDTYNSLKSPEDILISDLRSFGIHFYNPLC